MLAGSLEEERLLRQAAQRVVGMTDRVWYRMCYYFGLGGPLTHAPQNP